MQKFEVEFVTSSFIVARRIPAIAAMLILLASVASAADRSAPQPPKLRSPKDGVVLRNFPREVTFQWKDVSDRSGVVYYLQIDTHYPDRSGAGEWRRETLGPLRDNMYTHTHVGDQEGRWCVRAVDGAGNTGKWSETRSFTFYTAVPEDQQISAQSESRAERYVTPTPEPTPLPATPAPSTMVPPPALEPLPAVNTNYWAQPLPQMTTNSQLAEDLKSSPARPVVRGESGAPAAVSPKSPASGAHLSAYPREVTLAWNPVQESTVTYTVEVETTYPFEGGGSASRSQFYRNLTQTSVTHTHPGDYHGRWCVWAVNASGVAGPASSWRDFTFDTNGAPRRGEDLSSVAGPVESTPEATVPSPLTQEVAPVRPVLNTNAQPEPSVTPRTDVAQESGGSSVPAPIQESPRDGAIIDDDENYVICKWKGTEGAKFTLEKQTYDAATGQWSSEFYRNLTSMKKTANHNAPLPGRWRVQATYQGIDSAWSPWRYFTYHGQGKNIDGPEATSQPLPYAQLPPQKDELPPDTPNLSSPPDRATITEASRKVELEWLPLQDPSGVSYTCVVETQATDGQWQAHHFPRLQETRLVYQNPQPGKARWWVVAVDGAGNTSAPSKVHEILFEPQGVQASPTPQPIAPTTGAAVAPGDVDLTWSTSQPVTRVEVQVLESRLVGGGQWQPAVNQDASGTQLTVQIQPGYEVRWRVGSIGSDGRFTGTPWQYFHTGK